MRWNRAVHGHDECKYYYHSQFYDGSCTHYRPDDNNVYPADDIDNNNGHDDFFDDFYPADGALFHHCIRQWGWWHNFSCGYIIRQFRQQSHVFHYAGKPLSCRQGYG